MDYPFIYPKIAIPLFHLTSPHDPLFTVVTFFLMVHVFLHENLAESTFEIFCVVGSSQILH